LTADARLMLKGPSAQKAELPTDNIETVIPATRIVALSFLIITLISPNTLKSIFYISKAVPRVILTKKPALAGFFLNAYME
jgi:hypothetical protein